MILLIKMTLTKKEEILSLFENENCSQQKYIVILEIIGSVNLKQKKNVLPPPNIYSNMAPSIKRNYMFVSRPFMIKIKQTPHRKWHLLSWLIRLLINPNRHLCKHRHKYHIHKVFISLFITYIFHS